MNPSSASMQVSYHDLYWSIGDGGPQMDPYDHGQRTDTLFGTMVRISVPSNGSGYVVPSGNYEGGENLDLDISVWHIVNSFLRWSENGV